MRAWRRSRPATAGRRIPSTNFFWLRLGVSAQDQPGFHVAAENGAMRNNGRSYNPPTMFSCHAGIYSVLPGEMAMTRPSSLMVAH
jgi:hypothetical protein